MTTLTLDAHDPNPQPAAISTPTAAITIPAVANNTPEGIQSQKLKRFSFNKQQDVELLNVGNIRGLWGAGTTVGRFNSGDRRKGWAVKAEKEEETEQERKLVDAGKDIREKALALKGGALAHSEAGEDMGGKSTKSSARKRRTARNTSLSDEEMAANMLHQSQNRSELEIKRLKLEQERIDIEREWVERETERFDQMQKTTNRRLDLGEKRFAFEVEERKQSLEERKKMIEVMSLLAKKLA